MARDRLGFSDSRKFDGQGRPLKDVVSQPASEAYRKNWDRIFGDKHRRERKQKTEVQGG